MATIKDQLSVQARAIEAEWAAAKPMYGCPREGAITLRFGSFRMPMEAIRNYRGRANSSEVCGVPSGCLLLRGGKTVTRPVSDGGSAPPIDVTIVLALREATWVYPVASVDPTTWPASGRKFLVDTAAPPLCQTVDFEGLFDALGPPDSEGEDAPAEPSESPSPPGSWRDRPSLL